MCLHTRSFNLDTCAVVTAELEMQAIVSLEMPSSLLSMHDIVVSSSAVSLLESCDGNTSRSVWLSIIGTTRNGCDGRLMAITLLMTIQVNFVLASSGIEMGHLNCYYYIFTIDFPLQPFLATSLIFTTCFSSCIRATLFSYCKLFFNLVKYCSA